MSSSIKIKEVRTLTDEQVSLMIWSVTVLLQSRGSTANDKALSILKDHMDLLDADSKDVSMVKLINKLQEIKHEIK